MPASTSTKSIIPLLWILVFFFSPSLANAFLVADGTANVIWLCITLRKVLYGFRPAVLFTFLQRRQFSIQLNTGFVKVFRERKKENEGLCFPQSLNVGSTHEPCQKARDPDRIFAAKKMAPQGTLQSLIEVSDYTNLSSWSLKWPDFKSMQSRHQNLIVQTVR